MDFFEEILPHSNLKIAFELIFDDSYSEIPLYNRIKIAYESRSTHLSLVAMLRNHQKLEKNRNYCEEYLKFSRQAGDDKESRKKGIA